ncbi:MAG: single-stranded DNA-binding protein [Holosporales bacterium]|jgi:single-strand DNA-binding protein|nr:single-stranded DNA-binding protein [Holosporales bacterium]
MAGSINKVIVVGNVGKDPEIRTIQDGSKMASFSIATSELRKDKVTGERIEKTEWHRIAVFNDHFADIVERFVKKGSKLYVEGQLQTRKWTDAQGIERYTTEIVVSKFKGEVALLDARSSVSDEIPVAAVVTPAQAVEAQTYDDDVPF